jgi:hypothetical protein
VDSLCDPRSNAGSRAEEAERTGGMKNLILPSSKEWKGEERCDNAEGTCDESNSDEVITPSVAGKGSQFAG